jgi:lipoate-protein ligase A
MLAADGVLRKVSGNSLRMARTAFLYHGTLLYDFDLPLISRYLRRPPSSPAYRAGREHGDFVANLPARRAQIVEAIAAAWRVGDNLQSWPRDRVRALVESRYACDAWNLSR